MAIMLRKQRDGRVRPTWYAEFKDENGKRHVINTGVKWQGTPPPSGSLRDPGDAVFERSRQKAEIILEEHRNEIRRKGNAAHLIEKQIEAKTGRAMEYCKIGELAEKWRNIARQDPVKSDHLKQCDSVFAGFVEFMRARNPSAEFLFHVQDEDASAWLADLQNRYTSKTCRDYYGLLRGAFVRFLPVGYNNPFPKLTTKRNVARGETIHRKPFTTEELLKILETARNDQFLFPLVTCAVCTGLRRGDVCSLRWDAIDFQNNDLTVKTSKTGETVSIPIFDPLRAVLESIPKGRSPYVFPEAKRMLESNPTGLTYRLKRLIAEALGGGSKLISEESVEMTDGDVRAIRKGITNTTRCNLILECYRLNLNGEGYKKISHKTGLPPGTVGDYVRRATAITGKRALQSNCKTTRGSIDALTRQQRERGQKAASIRDWHALRTTWVTLALMADVKMEVVRSVTGHATVDVVLRHYFKPDQKSVHAALMKAMPGIITGKSADESVVSKYATPADELAAIATKVAAGTATEKEKKRLRVLAAKV